MIFCTVLSSTYLFPLRLKLIKCRKVDFFSAYHNGHIKDVHAKHNVFICVFNSARSSAPKDLINESQSISHLSKQTLESLMTIENSSILRSLVTRFPTSHPLPRFAYRRSTENPTCKVQYPVPLRNHIYTGAIDCSCSSFPLSSGKLRRLAFKLPFHCQVQKYTTGNFNCIFT